MKILTIIPLQKGLWREELTYFSSEDIAKGSIVTVPIRSKKVLGLVVAVEGAEESKMNIKEMDFNLRKVLGVKGASIFRKEYFEAATLVSKYFVANKSNTMTSLIPEIFREKYDKIALSIDSELSTVGADINERGIKKEIKPEKLTFQAPVEDRLTTYKTLIRGAFAEKKSVFIVLPTEADIKAFYLSLSRGIEQFTFALHAGVGPKKTIQIFDKILRATHPILIIGTTPFLSIPRMDIKTIILEHESSSVYRAITRPHMDLRVFVEIYAQKIKAKFILGDTLLSFDTIERSDKDEFLPLQSLSFRINVDNKIQILGPMVSEGERGQRDESKKFEVLKTQCIEEIAKKIEKKKNVFIFTLRKGLATMTICRDCNEIMSCPTCGSPVTLYYSSNKEKRMFICNRCQERRNAEGVCPYCGSWNLMPLGIGTDTVYDELKRIFPKEKIFKLDKESAKTGTGASTIMKEFEANPGAVLVGTEMALFYFNNPVSLSIIASFDSLWSIANFRMSEKILGLIIRIMGKTSGKLIIQTKNENDPALMAIEKENLISFVRGELEDRRDLGYPPFKRFIKIRHLGDKDAARDAREYLKELFQDYNPEIFSGFIARLGDKFSTNALIKVEPKRWSLPEISPGSTIDDNLYQRLLMLPPAFQIFVDPEDLL